MPTLLSPLVQPFLEDAVDSNNVTRAVMWLKMGADPNYKLSKPLLSRAALNGHLDLVRLLIAEGAAVNAKDENGDTALMYALKGIDIVSTVKKKASTEMQGRATAAAKAWVPMNAASKATAADKTTTWVLDDGGNIEAGNRTVSERKLPATAADVVKALLEAGANPNIASAGGLTYRQTPLMLAAIWGDVAITRRLIKARAQVNARDSDAESVLMYAAAEGTVDVVKALIAAGAALDLQNNTGATALHIAAQYNHVEVVKVLVAEGADTTLKKNMGATAFELAIAMQSTAAAKALMPAKPGAPPAR